MRPYDPPAEPYLDVVHEDADFLILNKPSGLLSVPGRLESHKDSLQSRVQAHYPEATTVHRLDMETSGLIIMARNKQAHKSIGQQFENRKVKKTYVARVFGLMNEDSGVIDLPLICDWPNRPRQKVDSEHGKSAETYWRVLRLESSTTLIELKPVTGRSHQLRVHMMSIGFPIVGDQLYAYGPALDYAGRLELHSQRIQFIHPESDKEVTFEVDHEF